MCVGTITLNGKDLGGGGGEALKKETHESFLPLAPWLSPAAPFPSTSSLQHQIISSSFLPAGFPMVKDGLSPVLISEM